MKTFLCIAHSSDDSVGDFPQVQTVEEGSKNSDPFTDNSKWAHKAMPENIIFQYAFSKRAKLTDLISSVYLNMRCGLLVSERLLEILKKFSLPDHQIIEGTINANGKRVTYYYVHFRCDQNEILDFSKTEFLKYDPWTKTTSEVEISSYSDYKEKIRGIGLTTINASKLYLESCSLDLYSLIYAWRGIFISERLYKELEENAISGFERIHDAEAICT